MTRSRKVLGKITFVGAGPGDPGLLAGRARDALTSADLVVADASVASAIVALAGADVRDPEATPAETAKLLGAEARNGLSVVRLVAGDPFAERGRDQGSDAPSGARPSRSPSSPAWRPVSAQRPTPVSRTDRCAPRPT